MKEFPERLKYFRSLNNLTQAEFASLIGLSPKQISDYEVGTSNPRKATFMRILGALGVSEEEFNTSNCSFNPTEVVNPLAMILASEKKGELIKISGTDITDGSEVEIHIYAGTITRTKQTDPKNISIYYLTGTHEEGIIIEKDKFKPVFLALKLL